MANLFSQNNDAADISPDQGATGPLVGFLESFNVAVQNQMRSSSQFGIEYFMHEQDWQQTKALLDAGVTDPPQLILGVEGSQRGEGYISAGQWMRDDSGYYEDLIPERSRPYLDVAKKYAGEQVSPEFDKRVSEYDTKIAELRKSYPNLTLKTSGDMFAEVKRGAAEYEKLDASNRRTWGGTAGQFLGATLSSLHPQTDPLNFLTAGVGGVGKTILKRVATEVGAQTVIEGVNQVTGVQKERELLGLSHGVGDALMRVGTTAVGAGVLQGGGELAVAGAKRWFRGAPADPAPPPPAARAAPPTPKNPTQADAVVQRITERPRTYLDVVADENPLSGLKYGKSRTVADLADVTAQLEDWGGPTPSGMTPTIESAIRGDTARGVKVDVTEAVNANTKYAAAKAADPQLFAALETMQARSSQLRKWIDDLTTGKSEDIRARMDAVDAQLEDLHAKHRTTQGKTAKLRIREEIASANKQREAIVADSKTTETPDVAMVRNDLAKTGEKLRALAPELGRAYARSRGEWGADSSEIDTILGALREGKKPDTPPKNNLPDYDAAVTIYDRVPILQRNTNPVEGEAPIDTVKRIMADDSKTMAAAMDKFSSDIARVLSETSDGTLIVDGKEHVFNIGTDKIYVEDASGNPREITIRQALKETDTANQELEAISTCSMRKTS